MGHVFRLYTAGGQNDLKDWSVSNGYKSRAINDIQDPNGATCSKEITSIPSPFARIDLVKNAFKIVAESGDLDNQNTIHHKLVSDCFDVGEIFFNFEKFRDDFEIIRWDVKYDLRNLTESRHKQHVQLGETLDMYLKQDGRNYNFDLLNCIYLLNYKGVDAPNPMNIVGATSPSTLFFTSANNLDYISKHISFGNDRPFDEDFKPLYKRDDEYILYWFGIQRLWNVLMPNTRAFSELFSEVNEYLNITYGRLSQDLRDRIRELSESSINEMPVIPITTKNDLVEVLNFSLRCKDENRPFTSDFYIDSNPILGDLQKTPLVLPVDTFRSRLVYTQDIWDDNTIVPIKDDVKLEERTLPNDGKKYPYLTMGDFLEDTIICNEYPLNSKCFLDGGDAESGVDFSYLLPIKREYFNYFTKDDLKKHLKISRVSTNSDKAVKVELTIPIKGENSKHTIVYTKFYYDTASLNTDKRDGKILTMRFALHIFPFIKVSNNADYRVHIIEEGEDKKFQILFFDNNKTFGQDDYVLRNETAEGDQICTGYGVYSPQTFISRQSFNAIQLSIAGVSNIIVPVFAGNAGASHVQFAVDFGTSNTHIECKYENKTTAFSIDKEDSLIQPLNLNYVKPIRNSVLADLIPEAIGNDYRFPTRTILSEKKNLDWNVDVKPMAETNIPFVYETMPLPAYNTTPPNLKWSKDSKNMARIKSYLENLFILMRSKVQSLGSSLDQTQIVWFYPASMEPHRVGSISDIWNRLYKVYFRGMKESDVIPGDIENNVITMSESTAPYYFYKNENRATTNVVSVDIGGGTSDILIVKDGIPLYLTSCKFAANAIFDSQPVQSNPFINNYNEVITSILNSNGLSSLSELATTMINDRKPASDVAMLFFSLINNREVKDKNIVSKVDFNGMLYDDERIKVLFILFYTALVYHIAKIMKEKEVDFPRHISFSGTGSKILKIMVNQQNKKKLEDYTKLIFEKVYKSKYGQDGLDILINIENPKEVTCKGGLLMMQNEDPQQIADMKVCLLGTSDNRIIKNDFKYKDIDSTVISKVVEEINSFTSLFFELNDEFSFNKNFASLKTAELASFRDCFNRDIAKSIKDELPSDASSNLEALEDTLFFYPIKTILSSISGRLNIKKNV